MKHLFIVRHEVCGRDNRVDYLGRRQMEALGKAMKEILNGGTSYLFSSSAPRALDSSSILTVELALPPEFEQVPYIWSGGDAPSDSYYRCPDDDRLMEIVNERRERADGLIMVTHEEVTRSFPSYFFKKGLGQDGLIGKISKGEAVHLDLEKRTYQILPR